MLEIVRRKPRTSLDVEPACNFVGRTPYRSLCVRKFLLVSFLVLQWMSPCLEAFVFLLPLLRSRYVSSSVATPTTVLLASRKPKIYSTPTAANNVADINDIHGHDDTKNAIHSNPNPSSSLSWMLRLEENARRLEEQVRQLTIAVQTLQRTINDTVLVHPMSSSVPSSSSTTALPVITNPSSVSHSKQTTTVRTATNPNAPKRAKLLIDGTWLYYTLYQRDGDECPIARSFGRDWASQYELDWSQLPKILQSHFQQSFRLEIDIETCVVFTSSKADTSHHSWRYQMFENMQNAGFRVHMMETLGKAEKCVDIALAVELLHVECDVALLLTGDKDFLPALVRARSPIKQVGLVSIRQSCNRALFEPPPGAIMDYRVIWLDQYLDQFVVPYDAFDDTSGEDKLSRFTIIKVLNDFIEQSGFERVSSRDVGRFLKFLRTDNTSSFLEIIKRTFGSLRQMLRLLPDVYRVIDPYDEDRESTTDRTFFIEMTDAAKDRLQLEAQRVTLTETEKRFFDRYSLKRLQNKTLSYGHTLLLLNEMPHQLLKQEQQLPETTPDLLPTSYSRDSLPPPNGSSIDYSTLTVVQLQQLCRERNLPVTGKKAVLLERIAATDSKPTRLGAESQKGTPGDSFEGYPLLAHKRSSSSDDAAKYLVDLITEYLKARGGKASSRQVGRYLAANKASNGDGKLSALTELKAQFGSISHFLKIVPTLLEGESHDYEFFIALKESAYKVQ